MTSKIWTELEALETDPRAELATVDQELARLAPLEDDDELEDDDLDEPWRDPLEDLEGLDDDQDELEDTTPSTTAIGPTRRGTPTAQE